MNTNQLNAQKALRKLANDGKISEVVNLFNKTLKKHPDIGEFSRCSQCESDTPHIEGECQICGTYEKKDDAEFPPDGCPNCKCEEIDYGDITIDGNEASQKCRCLECDTEWFDVYKYSHRQVIEK